MSLAAISIVVVHEDFLVDEKEIQRHIVVLGGKVKMDGDDETLGIGRGPVTGQEEELNGRRAGALTTMDCLRRQP